LLESQRRFTQRDHGATQGRKHAVKIIIEARGTKGITHRARLQPLSSPIVKRIHRVASRRAPTAAGLDSGDQYRAGRQSAEQRPRRDATAMMRLTIGFEVAATSPDALCLYSLASIIIFTAVFAALRPHMIALREATLAFRASADYNCAGG